MNFEKIAFLLIIFLGFAVILGIVLFAVVAMVSINHGRNGEEQMRHLLQNLFKKLPLVTGEDDCGKVKEKRDGENLLL